MQPLLTTQSVAHSVSCSFQDSWKTVLYDSHENSLNPCFLGFASTALAIVFVVFVGYQLLTILFNNHYGPHRINYSFGSPYKTRSVGVLQLIKVNSVLLQVILWIFLLSTNFGSVEDVKTASLVANIGLLLLLVLPLHFLEPSRAIVGSASLLSYWLVQIFVTAVVVLHDFFSDYKLYAGSKDQSQFALTAATETLLFLNSIFVFVLESDQYRPTQELFDYFELNDWNPRGARDLTQRFSYNYLRPMIEKAKDTFNLEVKDLPPYSVSLDNDVAYGKFLKAWNKSRARTAQYNAKNSTETKPSLFRPVLSIVSGFMFNAIMFDVLEFLADLSEPFLLQRFLLFITKKASSDTPDELKPPIMEGFLIATSIFAASIVSLVASNRKSANEVNVQWVINTALDSHIYHKAMSLSPLSRKQKASGSIVNHISSDVTYLMYSPEVAVNIFTQPFKFVIYMISLYKFIGPSVFAGIGVAVLMSPIASSLVVFLIKHFKALMRYKDERTKLTSEIFGSIKSVKLYSWEKSMMERLNEVRVDKEIKTKKHIGVLNSFISFVWSSIPLLMKCFSLFVASYWLDFWLTPDVLFPSLNLFNMLTEPVLVLPSMFSAVAEYRAANDRLIDFFILEEIENKSRQRTYKSIKDGENSVEIKDAYFIWAQETKSKTDDEENEVENTENAESTENTENVVEDKEALSNINFAAKRCQLTCVVGKVGTGKTTLLRAILGLVDVDPEKPPSSFKVNGTIAYCAQNAWILNSTVRENILFGRRYNKAFYNAVIEACELTRDFEILPDGDKTVVGEKGISLSGGQKARLSLARAVYSKADVYILDDILSAVDAHVARSIIDSVLGKKGLLANKTVILATNSVHVLHEADEIVLLEEKTIKERGTFDEVTSREGHLASLIKEFGKKEEETIEDTPDVPPVVPQVNKVASSSTSENEIESFQPEQLEKDLELARVATRETIAPSIVSFGHDYADDFDDDPDLVRRTEEEEEIKKRGKVDMSVYVEFFKACNYKWVLCYLFITTSSMLIGILNSYILKNWSQTNLDNGENYKVGFYMSLYTSIGVLSLFMSFIASYVIWTFCAVNGGRYFHEKMALAVLRAPMRFFETTPIGRILNRFTEDIGTLDGQIFWVLLGFANNITRTISVLIVVVFNLPFMVFVIIALLYVYNSLRQLFIPASRELKRLKAANKSPIFSHLSESIAGVETIEAYDQKDRFYHKMKTNVNQLIQCNYSEFGCNRWLAMRLQNLSAVVIYCSTLMILWSFSNQRSIIGPGMVGFIMTYALQVTNILNAITRIWASVESDAVVVERVIEYCNLEPEAEMVIEDKRPSESWPEEGRIEFADYETKYRENLDPVLNGINVVINPGEKVGIVGRTGAGKSTLTLALFRIIEATRGKILIDGIDISTIGLFDLRSNLNIIPQDSQVFDGTVRQNLDPLKKYSDEELWRVLELSHLKEHIENMKTEIEDEEDDDSKKDKKDKIVTTGLEAKLSEGGSNMSAGQKQLMCLARSLLNTSSILILDEATASVDVQTDKIVQQTIRSEFKHKTILTIAHRIDTILDSDKIIVLDKGSVKEHASPEELLSDKTTIFYSLCKESGNLPDRFK